MSSIEVEVVFALREKQSLKTVVVEHGATVAEVVCASGLAGMFPGQSFTELSLGIWGREVEKDQLVKAGDRIEVYRPLELDPREARRQLALAGRTMSDPNSD